VSAAFLTLRQLAERWQCSTKTVKRRARDLRLPITYVTRQPRIALAAIERAERRATVAASATGGAWL